MFALVRKNHRPGESSTFPTLPLRNPDEEVAEVEVCVGFQGQYTKHKVPSNAAQEEIERLGCHEYQGNVALVDFRPQAEDFLYRFKAMYCQDRESAVWTKCGRTDSADEKWVLFGQELSDSDIILVMEAR
jgi:hypothetical protein